MSAPKCVALIVASNGYQPIEYGHTRKALEAAGVKVVVSSDATATATATLKNGSVPPSATKNSEYATVSIDRQLQSLDPQNLDGIFLIGGPGTLDTLDNATTVAAVKRFADAGRPYGAICISPRILVKAELLDGKQATGWNDDRALDGIFDEHHVTYVKKPVVVDGNVVTAEGPKAAEAFGQAIAEIVQNK